MTKVLGANTVVLVGAVDLSQYSDASELTFGGDVIDNTTYGNTAHRVDGGLEKHSFKVSGKYDSTAGTGPRAVLRPLIMKKATLTVRPEGAGAGKPQDVFDAVLEEYVQSNPVADYIQWTTTWQVDGTINSAPQ